MTLTALNRQLTDLGGIAVLWDTDVGTLVQDPSQVPSGMPQNQYGPGDLFRDAQTGDIYQLGADGQLSLFRVAAAPVVPARPGAAAPSLAAGSAVGSAAPAWSNLAPQPSATGGTAAITPTGNPQQWAHQAVTWLGRASFIGGLPNGVLALLGYVGYTFMRQRRRRNPAPYRSERDLLLETTPTQRLRESARTGGFFPLPYRGELEPSRVAVRELARRRRARRRRR